MTRMSTLRATFPAALRLLLTVAPIALPAPACLILEYDHLQGYPAPVAAGNRSLGETFETALERRVCEYGEEIPIDPKMNQCLGVADFCKNFIAERRKQTFTPCPDGSSRGDACFTEGEILGFLSSSEDHRPSIFRSLRWYAHGLALPCCQGYVRNRSCPFPGLIWLGDTGGRLIREDFVVFTCESFAEGAAGGLKYSIHELGHVLNLHHCEMTTNQYVNTESGGFEGWSREHLHDHARLYVRPGELGADWCQCETGNHLTKMHSWTDCCDGTFSSSTDLPAGVSLSANPEKRSYLPGEPVRVRVHLKIQPQPEDSTLRHLGPLGLHPYLGHLRLWAGDSEDSLRALYPPALADAPPAWGLPTDGVDESEIVDLWYMLGPARAPSLVGATFTGLGAEGRGSAPSAPPASLQVASGVVPVNVEVPDVPPQGRERFTADESRLFLYLLGGDHLVEGIRNLQEVSTSESPYAPYANLALGVNLALPFHRYDRGSITLRPPDHDRARDYLERAALRRDFLPFSYRVVLDHALARTYEALGDRAAAPGKSFDPAAALALYEKALSRYREVATLEHASFDTEAGPGRAPLSSAEKMAVGQTRQRLGLLEQKVKDLRAGRHGP